MTTNEMIDAFAEIGVTHTLLNRKRLARIAAIVTTCLEESVQQELPADGEREHLVVSLLVVNLMEEIFQKTLDGMLGDDDGGTL